MPDTVVRIVDVHDAGTIPEYPLAPDPQAPHPTAAAITEQQGASPRIIYGPIIYGVLRAGTERRIRVNARYLTGGMGAKPWRVIEMREGAVEMEDTYDEVIIKGESRGVMGVEKASRHSCGVRVVYDKMCAWIETHAEIWVR